MQKEKEFQKLINCLLQPQIKSNIIEEIFADNSLRYDYIKQHIDENPQDYQSNEIERFELIRNQDIRELLMKRCIDLLQIMLNFYEFEYDDEITIDLERQNNLTQIVEIILQWGVINNIHKVKINQLNNDTVDHQLELETERISSIDEMKEILIIFHRMLKVHYLAEIMNGYMEYVYAMIIELDWNKEIEQYQHLYDVEYSVKSLVFLINNNKDETIRHKLKSEMLKLIVNKNALVILISMFCVGRMRDMPLKMSNFILKSFINEEDDVQFHFYLREHFKSIGSYLKKTEEKVLLYYLHLPFMDLKEIVSTIVVSKYKELCKLINNFNSNMFKQSNTKPIKTLVESSNFISEPKRRNKTEGEKEEIVEIKIQEEEIEDKIKEIISIQTVCEDLFEDEYTEAVNKDKEMNTMIVLILKSLIQLKINDLYMFKYKENVQTNINIEQQIISLHQRYFEIQLTYLPLIECIQNQFIKHIQQNEEEMINGYIECIQKILMMLSKTQRYLYLQQHSSVVSNPLIEEYEIGLIFSVLNQMNNQLDIPLNETEIIFTNIMENNTQSNYLIMNYFKYIMNITKGKKEMIYYQHIFNSLLTTIMKKDGQMYFPIIEYLSEVIEENEIVVNDIKMLLHQLSKDISGEKILILHKLRTLLIQQSSIVINSKEVEDSINQLLSILIYNNRDNQSEERNINDGHDVEFIKMLISTLSILSIHIDIASVIISKFEEVKTEKEGIVLIELLINIIVINKESMKVNQNISTIINSVLQIQIPHFFPYICIIFNYLFEQVPSTIYNSRLIENFVGLLHAIDYSNYEEDIKSFLHTVRNMIELVNDENVTELFTLKQMESINEVIQGIQSSIQLEDKEGYHLIKTSFEDYLYVLKNVRNPTFLL